MPVFKNGDGSFESTEKEEEDKRTYISLKSLSICLNEISDQDIILLLNEGLRFSPLNELNLN